MPGYTIDMEYWRSRDLWEESELSRLLMGFDPRNMDMARYVELCSAEEGNVAWERLEEDVNRAILAGKLTVIEQVRPYVVPARFGDPDIERSKTMRYFKPEEAIIWALKNGYPHFPFSNESIEKPLTETERGTLLRLVLGMAIDAYGYDPASKKNPATGTNSGSISASLEARGLRIDADTVRSYLKEAAEMYPEAKPRKS